jgi:hypothetical protein
LIFWIVGVNVYFLHFEHRFNCELLCSLLWLKPTNIFTKKKTEKKESIQRGGEAKKPKGNGISAEG